jgi:16S rRNA processing protein RimM
VTGSDDPTTKTEPIDANSGLSQPEFRYLAIGRVVRAHGVRGELSVAVMTDFPERFAETEWVYLGNETEATPYRLEKHRWHKDNVLLTLAGVATRTEAERLAGQLVQVPLEEAMPLPEGSYYLYQLMGLQVYTVDDELLGTITSIIETGANDVYVVTNTNGVEVLLPAIPDVVKSVEIEQKRMTVALIEGLI